MADSTTAVSQVELPSPRYLSVSEAAAALGLSPTSVQLLVERGLLKAWRTAGGHRRIHPDSVDDLLKQRSVALGEKEPAETPATRSVSASPTTTPASSRPLDVVIAEDDEFLIKLYEAKLGGAGFAISPRFAHDGVQALMAIGAKLPDALILDLTMPGLNGRDTLAALRKDARTARLPVFIVTGMGEKEVAALFPLPPGVALMSKPVPFDRLLGSLHALALVGELSSA
jgi:excisionase family DNA binding protein